MTQDLTYSNIINDDGTYTYTLDNTNAKVTALNEGETLTDSVSTITDGDGDTSTATPGITINGVDDQTIIEVDPPVRVSEATKR